MYSKVYHEKSYVVYIYTEINNFLFIFNLTHAYPILLCLLFIKHQRLLKVDYSRIWIDRKVFLNPVVNVLREGVYDFIVWTLLVPIQGLHLDNRYAHAMGLLDGRVVVTRFKQRFLEVPQYLYLGNCCSRFGWISHVLGHHTQLQVVSE